jgi:hypothetical protein
MQQEVDKLNAGQRDDFSTMSKEQLQRHCLTLKRQKEFLKQQAHKREQEVTENLGIPSKKATQFWKEGLDNKAAEEAHKCKTPAEVKEVARKLYWTEREARSNLQDLEEFQEIQSSKLRSVTFLP